MTDSCYVVISYYEDIIEKEDQVEFTEDEILDYLEPASWNEDNLEFQD